MEKMLTICTSLVKTVNKNKPSIIKNNDTNRVYLFREKT